MEKKLEKIREALADYMRSQGCGCCEVRDRKEKAETVLAGLLDVPMYDDGSGYRFLEFASDEDFVKKLKDTVG